jgi:antiviral helicase SKI2
MSCLGSQSLRVLVLWTHRYHYTYGTFQGCRRIQEVASKVALVQAEAGLPISVEEFVRSFRFGLVGVVYEWAKGMSFKSIMELTDIQEGSIVRCITRLDETCREVRNAARLVGDPTLYQKMEDASTLIARDIVFAASLYF